MTTTKKTVLLTSGNTVPVHAEFQDGKRLIVEVWEGTFAMADLVTRPGAPPGQKLYETSPDQAKPGPEEDTFNALTKATNPDNAPTLNAASPAEAPTLNAAEPK